MTDDDREGFEPVAPDDAGDPAAAFEALRSTIEKQGGQIGAEMTIIRRGVLSGRTALASARSKRAVSTCTGGALGSGRGRISILGWIGS